MPLRFIWAHRSTPKFKLGKSFTDRLYQPPSYFSCYTTLRSCARLKILRTVYSSKYILEDSSFTQENKILKEKKELNAFVKEQVACLCLVYASRKFKLQAAAFIRAVYIEPLVKLHYPKTTKRKSCRRELLCRQQIPCLLLTVRKLQPQHLLF